MKYKHSPWVKGHLAFDLKTYERTLIKRRKQNVVRVANMQAYAVKTVDYYIVKFMRDKV